MLTQIIILGQTARGGHSLTDKALLYTNQQLSFASSKATHSLQCIPYKIKIDYIETSWLCQLLFCLKRTKNIE